METNNSVKNLQNFNVAFSKVHLKKAYDSSVASKFDNMTSQCIVNFEVRNDIVERKRIFGTGTVCQYITSKNVFQNPSTYFFILKF